MHHACGAREYDSDIVQRGGRRVFPAGLDWLWRRWQCAKHGSVQPPAAIVGAATVRAAPDRAAPDRAAPDRAAPTEPPPTGQSVDHGRYVGTVTIDGVNYFGDALLAASGETHIYIGGPYTDDGTIQLASPEGSIDFVSPARTPSGHTVSGGVIGRDGGGCGQPGSPSARWCGRGSSAQMNVERTAGSDTVSIISLHYAMGHPAGREPRRPRGSRG